MRLMLGCNSGRKAWQQHDAGSGTNTATATVLCRTAPLRPTVSCIEVGDGFGDCPHSAVTVSSEPHAVLPPHMPASAVAAAAFPVLLMLLCLLPLISAAATAATAARYHWGCQQIMTNPAAVAAVAQC